MGKIDWRSQRLWHTAGYVVSAAWMVFVLVVSEGQITHPLFDYIFIVPLGIWIVGLAIARLLRRFAAPRE